MIRAMNTANLNPRTVVYGIPNCTTVKKAREWLTEHQVDFEFHDFKKQGVPPDALALWMAAAGWEKLLNTRGLMWRKLSDDEKSAVDAKKAPILMIRYPSLIKRPVLDTGHELLVGFTPESYAGVLK